MAVPGSDLLEDALLALGTDTIQILKQGPRAPNAVGQWVTSYALPVDYEASVQAVNQNTYVLLNLDFNKRYIQVYVSADVNDLARNTTGDKVYYNNKEYSITSGLDWFDIDGWVGLLCVEIVPEVSAP